MRRFGAFLAVWLVLLVCAGCITDPVTGATKIGAPISDADEEQMGLQFRPQIIQEFDGPYPDPELKSHLAGIVLPMAKRGARPDLPWAFEVLNTSVPNAFAVPGGQVFVTRGLLAELEDEGEFAVVMGHELGHVEHRHTVQQQGWQMVFGGIAAGVEAKWGANAGLATGVLSQLTMLKYSRDDETEADVRGVENSYNAGYDPREGADVFRMFLRLKGEGGGGPDWLSSHPTDASRIDNVLRLSAQKDPRLAGKDPVPGLKVTTPEWKRLIARVKQVQRSYERYDAAVARVAAAGNSREAVRAALPDLERVAADLPDHALPSATLGQALLLVGETDRAQNALERAASMRQQLFGPELLLGGLALGQQQWDRAVSHADRSLEILPGEYRSLWVRGEANWNRNRRAEAERDLRAVLEAAPKESQEYSSAARRLGVTSAPAQTPAQPAPRQPARRNRPR